MERRICSFSVNQRPKELYIKYGLRYILRPYFLLMYLRAISLGYAVPDRDFEVSVHSVFESAINLRVNDEGNLLTMFAAQDGDLPQGIRIDAMLGFSFEVFQIGEQAVCRDGILHFEKSALTVQLSGARRWKCDLPAIGRTVSPTCLSAWRFVWEALNARQRLVKAEIVAEELLQESAREGVPQRAGQAIRDLLSAGQLYTLKPSAVEALIGLGSGLTPSGDDLLVGYLAGLCCTTQEKSERTQFLFDLAKTVIELSVKTNDISRTYLYHATQGQVSSRLADLAEALCQGESPERLSGIADAAFNVGHTSGMDAVTGLLLGLAAWDPIGPIDFA